MLLRCWWLPGPRAAQPSPSPAQKQQASNLVKQAIAKSQAGDHATAIELYLQAYALIPQPLLLSNIGSEYQAEPGKQVEALKYFCKYLDAEPTGSNASYATAQAKWLQQQLGNKVDEKDVCKPAKPEATPPPPPPPDNTGSGAGSQVTGTSDLSPPPPAAETRRRWPRRSSTRASASAWPARRGLGAGIYFGIQAKNASDLISNHKISDPWPANIKQIEADGKSDQTKQIGFMVGGGVALAAGAVLYFVGRSHGSSSEEHVSVAPVVTAELGRVRARRQLLKHVVEEQVDVVGGDLDLDLAHHVAGLLRDRVAVLVVVRDHDDLAGELRAGDHRLLLGQLERLAVLRPGDLLDGERRAGRLAAVVGALDDQEHRGAGLHAVLRLRDGS